MSFWVIFVTLLEMSASGTCIKGLRKEFSVTARSWSRWLCPVFLISDCCWRSLRTIFEWLCGEIDCSRKCWSFLPIRDGRWLISVGCATLPLFCVAMELVVFVVVYWNRCQPSGLVSSAWNNCHLSSGWSSGSTDHHLLKFDLKL